MSVLSLVSRIGGKALKATGFVGKAIEKRAAKAAAKDVASKKGFAKTNVLLSAGAGAAYTGRTLLRSGIKSLFDSKDSNNDDKDDEQQQDNTEGNSRDSLNRYDSEPVRIGVSGGLETDQPLLTSDDASREMVIQLRSISKNINEFSASVLAAFDLLQGAIFRDGGGQSGSRSSGTGTGAGRKKNKNTFLGGVGSSLLAGLALAYGPDIVKKAGELYSDYEDSPDLFTAGIKGGQAAIKGAGALYRTGKEGIKASYELAKMGGRAAISSTGEVVEKIGEKISARQTNKKLAAAGLRFNAAANRFQEIGGKKRFVKNVDVEKILGKPAKPITKIAKSVTSDAIEKAIAKRVPKTLLKSTFKTIPVVGPLIAGAVGAGLMAWDGDANGAYIEVASGIAGAVPGAGQAISIGADLVQAGRYVYKDAYGNFPESDDEELRNKRVAEITEKILEYLDKKKQEFENEGAIATTVSTISAATSNPFSKKVADLFSPDYNPNEPPAVPVMSEQSKNTGASIAAASQQIESVSTTPIVNNITLPPQRSGVSGNQKTSATPDVSSVPEPSAGLPNIDLFYAGAL
jgi:hypothetical protein